MEILANFVKHDSKQLTFALSTITRTLPLREEKLTYRRRDQTEQREDPCWSGSGEEEQEEERIGKTKKINWQF